MLTKDRTFRFVKFPPDILKKSMDLFFELANNHKKIGRFIRDVQINDYEGWSFDNDEEFYSEYRKGIQFARFGNIFNDAMFSINFTDNRFSVKVELEKREMIEKVMNVFEESYEKYKIPLTPKEIEKEKTIQERVTLFIGHGRDGQWRDLKDHLHEKHGFKVEAYEIGARAGFTVSDILKKMVGVSSIAFLVFTGENIDSEGKLHARENVIHEAGLFQGSLGFRRAIVLLEDGCSEFSNIQGVHQIRFSKGGIRETFGDVIATINREFEKSS